MSYTRLDMLSPQLSEGISDPLNILIIPFEFLGHTNGSIGLAQTLVDRGHNVTFVVDKSRKSIIGTKFNVEIVDHAYCDANDFGEMDAISCKTNNKLSSSSVFNVISYFFVKIPLIYNAYKRMGNKNKQLKDIINKYNPDMFLIDDFIGYQAIYDTNKPWIKISSGHLLFLFNDPKLPAPMSGLPVGKYDWKWFKSQLFFNILCKGPITLTNMVLSVIRSPIRLLIIKKSPFLNIYGFPKEIDYPMRGQSDSTMFRVDTFMKREVNNFKLPEKFITPENQGKKLIYVTMGTICSADIQFMKRLVEMLSKSPNLFIVSKGYYHKEYDLADNMWGDCYLPQQQILELVDLVINHGGSNTVCESLAFGKPMILLPYIYISDIKDTAQRIHETGYGIKIDLNCLDSINLLNSIETLLYDKSFKLKLKDLSTRVWNDNRLDKAVELIEGLNLGQTLS